jgi:hypothetical protein
MLRGLSTTTSTTRGAMGRHTLSGTVTATTPATSTPARARAGSSSSSASVSLADSRSSSRWWPCLAARLVRLLSDLLDRDTGALKLRVDSKSALAGVDSKSALALAKNPVFHERSKHIRVTYHFIRGSRRRAKHLLNA